MIKVSVIIPVYNVEKYLPRCLDSIINQDFQDYEIICINDGSEDLSGKILEFFKASSDKIKVVNQENKGVSYSRNLGIELSKGEYIAFIDADDFVSNNLLSTVYPYAKDNDSDVVVFDMYKITRDMQIVQTTKWQEVIDEHGDKSFNIEAKNPVAYRFFPVSPWSKIYKKDLIKDLKFIENIRYEDFPYWTLVYTKAKKINYLPVPLYYYIIDRPEASTHNLSRQVFDNFKAFGSAEKYLKASGHYEKHKYIHWAHFASNIAYYFKRIDKTLDFEYISKIKELNIDIDIEEFLKQGFYDFENKDMMFLKYINETPYDEIKERLLKY